MIRILLVEDNPADVRLVQEMLVEANTVRFRINHVDRLGKVLDLLSRESFEVVLLDLSLPDAQGLETIKRVRAVAPALPIVVLSYHQDEEIALQAVQMGAQDYLTKGEETSRSLVRSIRYAIERKQAEEQLRENKEKIEENHHLFRAVIEGTTDSVYAKDLQGRYVMANSAAARLLGKCADQIVGRTDAELFPQETALRIVEDDRLIFASGETQTFEETLTVNDVERTFLSTKGVWRNHQGAVIGILGIARDITERKAAEEALRAHARQQGALAELGRHALAGLDLCALLDKTAALVARALETEYCKILELLPDGKTLLLRAGVGWREGLVRNATLPANGESQGGFTLLKRGPVVVEDLRTENRFIAPALLREHGAISGVSVLIPGKSRPFGTLAAHSVYTRRFTPGEIRFLQVVADMLGTIIERRRAEETIQHQAYYDALTGLPNRSLLENHLSLALAQAGRHKDIVALMFLDLDRFKLINDTLGHATGDLLLKAVSKRLAACLRDGDTFARMGGDEFTILLPEIETTEKITRVAERILEAFVLPFRIADQELTISASIGIALYPDSGCDAETLLRNADTALYHAKEQGRNTFSFFSPGMADKAVGRVSMESNLRRALDRKEFLLHYQPQVDLKTGEIVGFEALIRWHRPQVGLVSPADFIPIAEETGLILPIGEWVLRTACAQNKVWQTSGLPPVRMAVNLSACQFQKGDLVGTVRRVLEETDLDPHLLELELTESVLMGKERSIIDMLRLLAGMGIQLSIDDFGTGYSSLSYLRRFPINKLKVDQIFIRNMTNDPSDAVIAKTVVGVAHSLRLKAIAEGVETADQLDYLRSIGCNEIQGYFFSRPLPAEAATELLIQGKRL